MIKNYLKIAWRQMLGNRIHALINLSGLTIGITTLIFILLYLNFQYQHDQELWHGDRTFRVESNDWNFATPGPLAEVLKQNFSEIETYSRVMFCPIPTFSTDNGKHKIEIGIFVDPDFLKIFKIDFIYGSTKDAFSKPNSILLSQREAEKIFGNQNPVGKDLVLNSNTVFTVSGVFKNSPGNQHLNITALADFNTLDKIMPIKEYISRKTTFNFPLYLQLKAGVNSQELSKKINRFCQNQYFMDTKNNWFLASMSDVYFGKLPPWPGIEMIFNSGNYKNMQIFTLVALLVLLIAMVNFINLSTAVSALRSKEVGLRKVFGAEKSALIAQFLTESALLALLAGIFSWLLVFLLLPEFNRQIATDYSRWFLVQPLFITVYLLLLSVIGLLAGLFSALRFAFYPLLAILKKENIRGRSGLFFRRSLIAFQFFVSIVLLICTLLIYRQLNYMQNSDQGFAVNELLTVSLANNQLANVDALKQELFKIDQIKAIGLSRHEIYQPEQHGSDIAMFKADFVDSGYVKTLGLKLLSGRNFLPSDEDGTCIVNEKVVKIMQQTNQSILGKIAPNLGLVVGVVEDYHYGSFHQAIEPIGLIKTDRYSMSSMHIRFRGNSLLVMQKIQQVWQKIYPDQSVDLAILRSKYLDFYRPQKDFFYLFSLFAGLAVLIACLGIYGLAGYEVNRRTKEIGIRRVLGASTLTILRLMLKEACWLVILAGIIATPLAYYLMDNWLNSFALRIDIDWLNFILPVIIALLIAASCVTAVSLRVIKRNPVESLKYE